MHSNTHHDAIRFDEQSQQATSPPLIELPRRPTDVAVGGPVKRNRRADLVRVRRPSSSESLVAMFLALLSSLGDASQVNIDLRNSNSFKEHASRILDKFAASTVLKYMSSCSHFFKLLASLGYDLHTLSVGELADLLQVSSLSKSSDPSACGGKGLLKALRWLANVAMVTSLQALTYHQVINAFIVAKHIKDRQETAPFCLWLLYQFERRILQRSATQFEVAFLGATLVCIFGGLRFADSQRLPLRSLIIDASSLRGVCDRTKTSHHGQPWGLLISGLLSLGSFTWVSKYLMVLDELWHRSGLESIDYLFFTLNGDSISPMSYSEALKTLRYYIQCPWKSEQASGVAGINFTMHSMKTTLLAWAIQVPGISDDMRLVQGHHRGRSSLRTYSRDDVFLQLRLQSILIDAIRTGFRPQMAQHRGAQSPLVEPAVNIELFNKTWSPPTWRMFSFPTILRSQTQSQQASRNP